MCTQTWQTMSLRLYFFTDCTQVSSVSLWGKIYTLRPRETELSADQFSSVIQSCPTLCDPMDISIPGHPVHHQLPEFTQNSYPLSQWCHPAISSSVVPFSSCLQSFPASGSFPVSQFLALGGQTIGASASASVLPMNIHEWFSLGLTALISLHCKGLSRVFSNTTVQKH